jgi:hypothetical protein
VSVRSSDQEQTRGFHHPYRDHLYVYARAGHFVGALLPYTPVAPGRLYFKAVDERARENLWPHLLSFLSQLK